MQLAINNKKMKKTSFMATTALGLTLVAGLPASALAGPDDKSKNQRMVEATPDEAYLHLVQSSELIGAELYSGAGDSIGSLTDFIVDRGSGQIVFGIVKSGDFLGIGGKEIAVDYTDLHYNPVGTSFRTRMTKQELQRQTEYLPENWNNLEESSWLDKVGDWIDGNEDNGRAEASLRQAVADSDTMEIEGEVIRVFRQTLKGEEYVCATIRDDDDNEREVLVGPSWFISGTDYSIQRKDNAELRVVEYDHRWIAVGGEINDRSVEFRDPDGNGRWDTARPSQSRYVLLSDITGDSVELTGSTVGEVQATIVEGGSGQIAFIGFDPNENLFGLGDEISMIPWASLSIIDESTLMLDSNEAELQRAVVMPDSFDSMRTPDAVLSAYRVFGQEPPKFDHTRSTKNRDHGKSGTTSNADRTGDAWASNSEMVRAFSRGNSTTIEGKFSGMSTTRLVDGAPAAIVITLQTEEGVRQIVLGPDWYVNEQDIDFEKGDHLKVLARETSYKGEKHTAATMIDRDGERWVIWDDDKPMWSN